MSSIALSRGAIKRGRDGRKIASRLFSAVIAILVVILIIEIVFHLVIAPRMIVRKVDIISDGSIGLDYKSLLTIAELTESPYYFDVDTRGVAELLETYPLIKKATVEKSFPNTLRIHVTGRQALAIALVERGSRVVPVAFDEEGIVFQIGSSVRSFDLPVVSGLTFSDVRLGQRIARPLTGFLSDLYRLKKDAPVLFNLISEVKFIKKNRSGFEVVLFPRDFPVRINLGTEITEEIMKRVVLVLDVVAGQGLEPRITGIDFRTDDVVMRVGGE